VVRVLKENTFNYHTPGPFSRGLNWLQSGQIGQEVGVVVEDLKKTILGVNPVGH